MTQQDWEVALLALLLWREARGETVETKRVVASSIRNRVLKPGWWGTDWISVMTKREQYSSMTHIGDGNTTRFPLPNDTSWIACMEIASEFHSTEAEDICQGATHYFDRSLDSNPPGWAAEMVYVMDSGAFHFYR